MGFLKFCLVILFVFSISGSFAQFPENEFNSYLKIAYENNPGLKASFNQYLSALEKVPHVGSLPDPQLTFGYFLSPMELIGGNQVADIQVMQMFPWFGTLKISRDEATMMAKSKYEAFNISKAELFYNIKSQWYELMKFDREIELVRENIKMMESLEKLIIIKFQSPVSDVSSSEMNTQNQGNSDEMNQPADAMGGMNNQTNLSKNMEPENGSSGSMSNSGSGLKDVFRVRMEILEQKNKLELLSDRRQLTEANFNALLNRNIETPVQISDSLIKQPLPIDRSTFSDSISNNNYMLEMLANESRAYILMEQKTKKMRMPMLGLGLNYMLIDERKGNTFMMNGKDMVMPMISISIPLYQKKYTSMQTDARLMNESANLQIADLKNNLMVQSFKFIQELDDAERRIELYKELENLARTTTNLLISELANSGNNYEEILRMQLTILDYGFRRIEAIVDYNTVIADVEKYLGKIY